MDESVAAGYPLAVAASALHRYRDHDRTRIGKVLSTGGLSLIFTPRCDCVAYVTAMFAGLLDAGYVIVKEDLDAFIDE